MSYLWFGDNARGFPQWRNPVQVISWWASAKPFLVVSLMPWGWCRQQFGRVSPDVGSCSLTIAPRYFLGYYVKKKETGSSQPQSLYVRRLDMGGGWEGKRGGGGGEECRRYLLWVDRPRFNTKSILLQSAITVCWLKQMAAMNSAPGPVSVA